MDMNYVLVELARLQGLASQLQAQLTVLQRQVNATVDSQEMADLALKNMKARMASRASGDTKIAG